MIADNGRLADKRSPARPKMTRLVSLVSSLEPLAASRRSGHLVDESNLTHLGRSVEAVVGSKPSSMPTTT